jgi:hypothetical protein
MRGTDAELRLHGCIYAVLWNKYPISFRFKNQLNNYNLIFTNQCASLILRHDQSAGLGSGESNYEPHRVQGFLIIH